MADTRKPYRMWNTVAPFRKNGSPVVGNMGSRTERVIIMTHETFSRLVREHPSLADAYFEMGEL